MKNQCQQKNRKAFHGLGYQLDNEVLEGTQQIMIIWTRIEIDIVRPSFSKLQNWVMYEIVD